MLIRQLPATSALVRALNGGQSPFTRLENLVADLWALWAKKDHPARAEMAAKARQAKKQARVNKLRATYEKKKRTYGLG